MQFFGDFNQFLFLQSCCLQNKALRKAIHSLFYSPVKWLYFKRCLQSCCDLSTIQFRLFLYCFVRSLPLSLCHTHAYTLSFCVNYVVLQIIMYTATETIVNTHQHIATMADLHIKVEELLL